MHTDPNKERGFSDCVQRVDEMGSVQCSLVFLYATRSAKAASKSEREKIRFPSGTPGDQRSIVTRARRNFPGVAHRVESVHRRSALQSNRSWIGHAALHLQRIIRLLASFLSPKG